MTIYFPTMIE